MVRWSRQKPIERARITALVGSSPDWEILPEPQSIAKRHKICISSQSRSRWQPNSELYPPVRKTQRGWVRMRGATTQRLERLLRPRSCLDLPHLGASQHSGLRSSFAVVDCQPMRQPERTGRPSAPHPDHGRKPVDNLSKRRSLKVRCSQTVETGMAIMPIPARTVPGP